jgi:hypothetical protein
VEEKEKKQTNNQNVKNYSFCHTNSQEQGKKQRHQKQHSPHFNYKITPHNALFLPKMRLFERFSPQLKKFFFNNIGVSTKRHIFALGEPRQVRTKC